MQTLGVHEGTKSRNILKCTRHGQYKRIKSPLCNQALHHLQMHRQLQTIRRKQNCSWSLQRGCSCSGTHLKGKNYPHGHLDTEFLPLKFTLLSLFCAISLQSGKNIWALQVGFSGRIKPVTHGLQTLLYRKIPQTIPSSGIFSSQSALGSQGAAPDPRQSLIWVGAKTLLPNSF